MQPLTRVVLTIVLGCVVFASPASAAEPAKKREPIYDVKADVRKDVTDAVARAKKDNKRVLLVVGGNWCGWCYLLHDLFKADEKIRGVLQAEYEVLNIDSEVGANVVRSYEIQPQGFPYLAVLSGDDKLLTQQDTGSLEDGPKHDPAKVLAFLQKWKAEPLDAQRVFDEALTRAAKEDKRLFVRFGAPWCGPCRRLDKLLSTPAVDAALQQDFVVRKIDIDRMTHGAEVAKKYQTGGGIPWYCIMTADGKSQATSDLPGAGNIGFPTEPAEVDHIIKILTDGRKRMTDAQVASIRDAFTKGAAECKADLAKARAAAKAAAQ